jgi:hypothetical protein
MALCLNAGMPHYVADKVADALNTRRKAVNGSNILIAGVAYKRDIDDMRESPAMDVMGLLLARGAKISYADPYVPVVHAREWAGGYDLHAVDITRGHIAQYDCVVIITDHRAFDYQALVTEADLVVDTRNAIKERHPHVFPARRAARRPLHGGQGRHRLSVARRYPNARAVLDVSCDRRLRVRRVSGPARALGAARRPPAAARRVSAGRLAGDLDRHCRAQ